MIADSGGPWPHTLHKTWWAWQGHLLRESSGVTAKVAHLMHGFLARGRLRHDRQRVAAGRGRQASNDLELERVLGDRVADERDRVDLAADRAGWAAMGARGVAFHGARA